VGNEDPADNRGNDVDVEYISSKKTQELLVDLPAAETDPQI